MDNTNTHKSTEENLVKDLEESLTITIEETLDTLHSLIDIVKTKIDDPSVIQEILTALDDKKKPIDYRRGGVITLFVGFGIFLLGISFANIDNEAQAFISGAGLLVAAIGVGSIIAGYLYPNESAEISKAVEKFEE